MRVSRQGMTRAIVFALAAVLAVGAAVSVSRKVRAAGLTFTTIDFPGAAGSLATDINDSGQIVGEYNDNLLGHRHGFLLSNGVFSSIDFPGATFTRALGINRFGDIVGDEDKIANFSGNGNEFGYLLKGGLFTSIAFPNSDATVPAGINANDDIVGWYLDNKGMHGFLLSEGSLHFNRLPWRGGFHPGMEDQ